MKEKAHCPVLLEETLSFLKADREGTYIDCTLGLAGHAAAILERNPHSSLIGLDRDERSLLEAREVLKTYAERVQLFQSDFKLLPGFSLDWNRVRGVLVDLGISSFQLDSADRGFSYSREGPLDMRTDGRSKITAERILHGYSEQKLANLFEAYGELSRTRKLAREIVNQRKLGLVKTTTDLREIVERVYSWRPQKGKTHPAAKVFQALRIEVNQELEGLGEFLAEIVRTAAPKTRLVVISFHSLEDRIVKHTFSDLSAGDGSPLLRILTKKPVSAGDDEIAANSRARSAKLRAAERI